MCLNKVTTHKQCLHLTWTQIPCSHPSSKLAILSFVILEGECRKRQENKIVDTFCAACSEVWDSLRASEKERRERTKVFRKRNRYHGQLVPVRRVEDGSVEFASDLRYQIQVTGRPGEEDAVVEDEARYESTKGTTSRLRTDSYFEQRSSSDSSSSFHTSTSRRSSESSRSIISSSSTVWPTCFGPPKDDEKLPVETLPVETDEFGNPMMSAVDTNFVKDRLTASTELELGAMYRDQDMRRLLREEIRPVAPMVAPMVAGGFSGMRRQSG